MNKLVRTGFAGSLLALALAAPAVAAPNVLFRVEGEDATLMPRKSITLLDDVEPNTGCPGNSGSAAIEIGTAGDWDRQPFFETVLGETHDFSNDSDYWSIWVFRGGHYVVANGACDELLADGEEMLVSYQQAPPPDYAPQHYPLWVEGVPAKATVGEPFTVTVRGTLCEQYCAPGEGHAIPVEGATVTAGSASATSGADGTATLTLTTGGDATVQARRGEDTPSAIEPTCATTGADGLCGTTVPTPTSAGAVAGVCAHDGDDGRCGTRDRRPPQARVSGIDNGQTFTAGEAPRELSGTVETDASGLHMVKLRLTRRLHGRCAYFSGGKETFRPTRCGRSFPFRIGDSATWSYLLPDALDPGRYVLDVIAIDGAFNRDPLARGRNRIVFRVS